MNRLVLLALLVVTGSWLLAADAPRPVVIGDEARKIHAEMPVFDGHNDLPWALRTQDGLSFRTVDLTRDQPTLHTDLPRLKTGGVGAQFWSAFVPVDTAKKGAAVTTTLEQIDVIHRLVKQYPTRLEMAYTVADIERILGSDNNEIH